MTYDLHDWDDDIRRQNSKEATREKFLISDFIPGISAIYFV